MAHHQDHNIIGLDHTVDGTPGHVVTVGPGGNTLELAPAGGGTNPLVYVENRAALDAIPLIDRNDTFQYCVKFDTNGNSINLLFRWDATAVAFIEVAPNITFLNSFGDNVLSPTIINGVIQTVTAHDGLGVRARFTAYDLIRDIQGGSGVVTYGIEKSNFATGNFPVNAYPNRAFSTNPKDAFIEIDCPNLGTTIVNVWVKDEVNTTGIYAQTFVIPQDNNELCGDPP